MAAHFIAFTRKGAALCGRLLAGWNGPCEGFAPKRYCTGAVRPLESSVAEWAKQRFAPGETLVFIGSAGIAVRAIAPYVRDKKTDPAVLCMDDGAGYVVPLLSGHIGGANAVAKRLAKLVNAVPVLTTATDVAGVFSPDAWASANGCAIVDSAPIRHISAALLDGEPVGLASDYPVDTPLPNGVQLRTDTRCGILLSQRKRPVFPHTLHLLPRSLVLGVGCRRDTPFDVLDDALQALLHTHGYARQAIAAVATITLKEHEPAVRALCENLHVPLRVFSAQELLRAPGRFTSSEFVRGVTGVDNVCERAAVCAGGRLLVRKTAGQGVALALAELEWRVCFEHCNGGD